MELTTGLSTLDRFAWIGAFSSGSLDNVIPTLPELDANANAKLRLLWIACGTDDSRLAMHRQLRAWLTSRGVQHVDVDTPGGHEWMVWRRNLATFASLLFRSPRR